MFVVLVLGEGATYYILHWLSASLLLLELLFLSKINKPNLNIYPTVLILKLASCSLEKYPHCSSFFLYLSYIFVILFFSIFVSSYIFLYLEIQTHTDTQVSPPAGRSSLWRCCAGLHQGGRRLLAAQCDVLWPLCWHHWCNPEHWLTALLGRGCTDGRLRVVSSAFHWGQAPRIPQYPLIIHSINNFNIIIHFPQRTAVEVTFFC